MTVADIPDGFDVLAATRVLEAAGVERRHAEAVVTVVRASRAGLATKTDLDNLEARMNMRFVELEGRMFKAAISIVLAQTALTVGLLKLPGVAP